MLMKKYIVFVVTLTTTLGSLSARDWYSADITITYRYSNDLRSRSAGLVPQQLDSNLNNQPTTLPLADHAYCITFKVSINSTQPTSSLARIKKYIIDRLGLNEFVTLSIFNDQGEEVTTSKLLISDLQNATLNATYNPNNNTPEKIQNRRIEYVIDDVIKNYIDPTKLSKWKRRDYRELIKNSLKNNYLDEQGKPRLFKELEKLGRAALPVNGS